MRKQPSTPIAARSDTAIEKAAHDATDLAYAAAALLSEPTAAELANRPHDASALAAKLAAPALLAERPTVAVALQAGDTLLARGERVNAADAGDAPDWHTYPDRVVNVPAMVGPIQQVPAMPRTASAPSREYGASVSYAERARSMGGAGTEAASYPVTTEGPQGTPESLKARRALVAVALNAALQARYERPKTGLPGSRKERDLQRAIEHNARKGK